MRKVLLWRGGAVRVDPPEALLALAADDPVNLLWMDLEGDPAPYGDELARRFGISALARDTLDDQFERARFMEGDGYYYLVVHGLTFDAQSGESDTPKLDLIFGRNFLVTSHLSALPWLSALRESTAKDGRTLSRGVAFLLHSVLDTLVDSYFPVLDDIDGVIDDLEDDTVSDTSNATQARIFRIKRSLAQMRRFISPQVELFNSLIVRTGTLLPEEARPYYADVHDHLVRSFEVLDSYRDLMSGLLDVYLTTVSNRLNVVMKQLTIYAAIFLPITFITGVFGQNFGHLPQVEHDAGWDFWLVLLLMALIAAGHLVYFRWKKWL